MHGLRLFYSMNVRVKQLGAMEYGLWTPPNYTKVGKDMGQ